MKIFSIGANYNLKQSKPNFGTITPEATGLLLKEYGQGQRKNIETIGLSKKSQCYVKEENGIKRVLYSEGTRSEMLLYSSDPDEDSYAIDVDSFAGLARLIERTELGIK